MSTRFACSDGPQCLTVRNAVPVGTVTTGGLSAANETTTLPPNSSDLAGSVLYPLGLDVCPSAAACPRGPLSQMRPSPACLDQRLQKLGPGEGARSHCRPAARSRICADHLSSAIKAVPAHRLR